jgi:hypothetical protein
VKIQSFLGYPYANVDEVGLSDVSPEMYNGYLDDMKYRHNRPGLDGFIDLNISKPISGLYWWETGKCAIAVCNGRVWRINDSIGTNIELTGTTLETTGTRVSFTEYGLSGKYCVMANGGRIVYTDGATLTKLTATNSPTNATHIASIDQYLLANSIPSPYFYWSNINDITTWNALSFASSEVNPDNIVAISSEYGEIFLVGSKTIESWYNDGVNPFSRLSGTTSARGISAPYSWQFADNTWIGLDNYHHIIMLSGRSPVIVSTPFDKLLHEMEYVADAIADVISISGRYIYVISFPSEDLTLAFDVATKSFVGKWSWWNQLNVTHERWLGNCYCYAKDWNIHLVGDRRTGKIYKLSTDYYTDNGDTIRHSYRTGHVDHGTRNRKRSKGITFKFKRGSGITGNETTAPEVMLRWRDNNGSEWSNERKISLGAIGNTELYAEIKQLGTYRSRQYEMVLTDDAPVVLVDVDEDVEELMR